MGIESLIIGAISAAGTAAQFQGSRQQAAAARESGRAQQQANEFNAQVARQTALEQERKAIQQSRIFRRETGRIAGRNRALIGKSGVTREGSPLLALEENAAAAELDNFFVLREGEIQRNRALAQSRLDVFQGRVARRAGSEKSRAILLSGKTQLAGDIVGSKAFKGFTSGFSKGFSGK